MVNAGGGEGGLKKSPSNITKLLRLFESNKIKSKINENYSIKINFQKKNRLFSIKIDHRRGGKWIENCIERCSFYVIIVQEVYSIEQYFVVIIVL